MAQLGSSLDRAADVPGLCLLATADDAVGSVVMRRRAAASAGAHVATLPGLGHWWMLQAPARGAREINDFWASLPRE